MMTPINFQFVKTEFIAGFPKKILLPNILLICSKPLTTIISAVHFMEQSSVYHMF